MKDVILDTLAIILWILTFASPLITIPLVWKIFEVKKIYRIIIGLVLALCISLLSFYMSIGLVFRNGMGPG